MPNDQAPPHSADDSEPQLSDESALRYWFRLSGLSKSALARAVTERASQRGHPQVRPDGSRVRRWINDGERPRDPVPGLIAEILSEHTGYRLSTADLGLGPAPGNDKTRYRGPAEVLGDIERVTRATLVAGPHCAEQNTYGETLRFEEPRHMLTALETWTWKSPRPLPSVAAKGGLGHVDAERLSAYTTTLRQMDNQHGGASMLHMGIGHLAATNTAINTGTYTETAGRALFRELGDLAGVVGWASHDAGNYPQAITYLTLAVHAARESGDLNLTAHLLQCLARIWGYVGHPQHARDCIALALYGTRNTANPALRAGLHALDARFAALLGRSRDALRALHLAQEIFADDSSEPTPAFISYLDDAELASVLGEVLLFLARTTEAPRHAHNAVELLSAAVEQRSDYRVRSRVFDAIALARAYLFLGEFEAAHTTAEHAAAIGAGMGSARVNRRYRDLAREAADHLSVVSARQIHDLLTQRK
ncbi:transcriptional regulator [Nocardiopsis metallicus]|uniref:Tetratricopeptide (TPR) repeat protein n=1 Tax=Nocardiopsis metallicus TaxID=179819 RepID=A0A840WSB5_9ACTN|nr:transcriptional regulator [Nocardiopsis metallicus]MBB5494825.1 tetratricopeptide (TPR) repeat protein [Nocardiopsis metallicus]